VGGDEFVVLLPEADPARAHSVAERLRVGVHEAVPGLTVSIGVASEDGSGAALERLLTRADKALYAAKSGGRDRVAVAEPLTATAPGAGEP
jgi:diguanylate cyclase (GGDEF)-like protein